MGRDQGIEVGGNGVRSGRAAAMGWFVPILLYAIGMGFLGVVIKLALRGISWQETFLWTTGFYCLVAISLIGIFGVRPKLSRGNRFAALSGVMAASGLLCLFMALENADAGRVIPTTAAYPVLTAALAAVILAERVTPIRLLGTILVVCGIVLIGLE